MKTVRCHRKLR